MPRDYGLTGPEGPRAEARGLTRGRWYRTPVDRDAMRALMARTDAPALRDTAIWLGGMAALAGAAIWLMPSWWALPFWLAYGVLYGSASDSRWHECGHGTAFATKRCNEWVYQIASFMIVRNPVVWRRSHARHHAETIVVGRDPEIAVMRPPDALRLVLNLFGIVDALTGWGRMLRHAAGALTAEERAFVPPHDAPRAIRIARIWTAIYAATLGAALAFQSWIPVLLIGGPRLYGAWHHVMCGLLQHGGLAEDVSDHRLNTRTVLMNPVSRFLYWNMNYHLEHHMFPAVPYHRLPKLHALLRHDLPPPSPSIAAAYREMLPILWAQLRGEDRFLTPRLPNGAA
ncbi:MAG: fatty acid desaturase family protein [Hasllibacter sp.]